MKHPVTGVELGAGSPLLTKGGRQRNLGPSEAKIQMAAVEALLGKLGPGPRPAMQGLAARYPELWLINAINPNPRIRLGRAQAGQSKAMGLLADMPDLHLPVTRGPFLTLYVEIKRPGEFPSRTQKEMHALLQNEGHCVVWCTSAQEIVDTFVGYLTLLKRDVALNPWADDMVAAEIMKQRAHWNERLKPAPRARHEVGTTIGR
ncbi:MAG: hypothetical protein ACRDQZ_04705 [Mycobacteriales bacterium]